MTFLETIKEKNQFPIIFIGSGITQRYFKNSPTWEGLLKDIWMELFDEDDFYTKVHELGVEYNNGFDVYLRLADYLEDEINKAFWSKKISLPELSLKEAHEKRISPFKELIAQKFKNLDHREGFEEEIIEFSKMLSKARIIITTNYDNFIEDCLKNTNTGIKVNVGNKGLFSKSSDYGELYKIHGSITEPNSISITSKDYNSNGEKSSIINAKILSNLVEAPILFLGYSLTDENIRKLLTDFARNSPYNIQEASEKIGVIEYVPDEEDIIELISEISDLSIHYTQLRTDNFIEIYRIVSSIDQGFLPSEISKFERAFRKIIEIKGEDKELKTVLTSYLDLSTLSDKEIREKNIVVAFGDGHYIYKFPDILTYSREYFKEKSEMPLEIILGFIAQQPSNSNFPIRKYLKNIEEFIERNKETRQAINLKKKLDKEKEFNYLAAKESLRVSQTHLESCHSCQTVKDVMAMTTIPKQQRITYIASHLDKFDTEEIKNYIVETLEVSESLTTEFRKLLKIFDHYISE